MAQELCSSPGCPRWHSNVSGSCTSLAQPVDLSPMGACRGLGWQPGAGTSLPSKGCWSFPWQAATSVDTRVVWSWPRAASKHCRWSWGSWTLGRTSSAVPTSSGGSWLCSAASRVHWQRLCGSCWLMSRLPKGRSCWKILSTAWAGFYQGRQSQREWAVSKTAPPPQDIFTLEPVAISDFG